MGLRAAIEQSLSLLSRRDRRLLGLSALIQIFTSFLDLIGVLLLGLVGALAVATIQSEPPPEPLESLLDLFGLAGLSLQQLVILVASLAAVVLLAKSLISSWLIRRVLVFLANRQALVTARLTQALLTQPLTFLQQRSSQETAFALIQGAGAATVNILGQSMIAITESSLLIVLSAGLFLLDPWVTIGAILYFALIAFALQRAMGRWASRIGHATASADIASLNAIQEALSSYREIVVTDRRALYVERIQALRWDAAKVAADASFIGMFPKYIFEAALVVGGFILATALFSTQDALVAVGTLAVFLTAGSRVMPSILRLQGAALGLRSSAGVAAPTFELARELQVPAVNQQVATDMDVLRSRLSSAHVGFVGSITLIGVSARYPMSDSSVLRDVSLSIESGTSVAILGRSGAGKTTLADLILGVLHPESGDVLIGNSDPATAQRLWPGAIAYVPQDVVLSNDTVRANVALGIPRNAVDDAQVWEALERAHLATYLRSERSGLDTHVGEGGLRLSGGQRQRLGIARALFTRPRLLVLDEATSALDAETELAIGQMIADLGGHVTTVVIAHRLSTVRNVDLAIYLDAGRVRSQGTFTEVRNQVPELDRQARLMGL